MTGTIHIVGAGLAGLAAAVAAAKFGARVALHEAAGHAGGRCRSFLDEKLGRVIDNGSHLVLGANRTALAYAQSIGGLEAMVPTEPRFPFFDLATGERWEVTPARTHAGIGEILRALGLPWTGKAETVASRLGKTRSYIRFWLPMCEAILNTAPAEASASMFAWTMRRALLGGRPALTPWTFPLGLSAALVAPALATLGSFGAEVNFRRRLTGLSQNRLDFDGGAVDLGPEDRVILALPPWALNALLPGACPDLPTRPIVNAHFRLPDAVALPGQSHFLGLVNAAGHWLFARGDVLSVTVSAAGLLADLPPEDIAAKLWDEASQAMNRADAPLPPFRIIKERRATLAHDPASIALRPSHAAPFPNMALAGDWLASPWPCTIEAAIASGLGAARLILGRPELTFAR